MLNKTFKSVDDGTEEKIKLKIKKPKMNCSIIGELLENLNKRNAMYNNSNGAKAIGIALKNLMFENVTEPKMNPPSVFLGINENEFGLPKNTNPIIK